MLQEISIRNFAIIADLSMKFESGLTILSGETGAGKSIIINAVNLILGSRASATLIRTGADSAELEALFHISHDSAAAAAMQEHGYDFHEGLLVRRIISRNDRHRIYINGRLATMQVLTAITADLASISGQHAHQRLLKEDEHLNILDQYGGLFDLCDAYRSVFQRMIPLIHKEQVLLQQQARQGEHIALLNFQRDEIAAACIELGEDELLEKERLKLKNSENLFQTIQMCVEGLYNSDGAVVERLGVLSKALFALCDIDEHLKERVQELEALTFGVEDLVSRLRDYINHIETDVSRLAWVEERLDALNKLKRKYGGSLSAVVAHGQKAAGQLEAIENLDTGIAEAQKTLQESQEQLIHLAEALTEKRQKAAYQLSRSVEQELAALRMADTRFSIQISFLPVAVASSPYLSHNGRGLGELGQDRITFMIAPNVGEAMKPLAAIASGGELSRVVLALKAIVAANDSVETVVFDEVDAGIGGDVAEMVGKKLEHLACCHQILCITHLPQIAKYADHHFRIVKSVSQGRTHTTIKLLSTTKERINELARMLGGEHITAMTQAHAKEMLETVRKSRGNFKLGHP